jgi:hypothetical protein
MLCLGYGDVDGDSDDDDDEKGPGGGRKKRSSSLLQFLKFGASMEHTGEKEMSEEDKTFLKFGKIRGQKTRHAATSHLDTHHLKDYVAFVPRKVLPQLPAMEVAEARCTNMQGVVSFLDVAGFTKLTERLAMQVGEGCL